MSVDRLTHPRSVELRTASADSSLSDTAAHRQSLTRTQVGATNKMARALWHIVWLVLYRPSPRVLHAWRCMLLRMFGARIATGAHPYPRAKIWAPWNLEMHEHSCLSDEVDCYCVARITLGRFSTVSQYSYLCSASHDYRDPTLPLVAAPITIESDAWVAADVFVGPGVCVGEGAVIGARSALFKDAPPWKVLVGSPATVRADRPRFSRSNGKTVASD